MDSDRRSQLEQRRQDLQGDLALRRRRESIAFETSALDRAGVRYAFDYDADGPWNWITEHFPINERGIDWAQIANRVECQPEGDRDLAAVLSKAMPGLGDPAQEVEVVFSNGHCPTLRMQLADALFHADMLLIGGGHVISRCSNWVLEYASWEGWRWAASG